MKFKKIFTASLFLNAILITTVFIYLFTPFLDFAVIEVSAPRLCKLAEETAPDEKFPLCELLKNHWDIIESELEALRIAQTVEEEAEILETVWAIAYENTDIDLVVKAIDAKRESVINNLSEGEEPITITITFSEGLKSENIEFIPLDIENIYILLRE